jgi:hypothetical protein
VIIAANVSSQPTLRLKMYFDRFDICLAYWLFAVHFHVGQFSPEYAILGRLERMRFRPGFCQSDRPADLPENAREIYRRLVVRRFGIRSTATN